MDFGDGSTSIEMKPAESYANGGTYTIKMVNRFATCADSSIS